MYGLIMTLTHESGASSTTTMPGFLSAEAARHAGRVWFDAVLDAFGKQYTAVCNVVSMGADNED